DDRRAQTERDADRRGQVATGPRPRRRGRRRERRPRRRRPDRRCQDVGPVDRRGGPLRLRRCPAVVSPLTGYLAVLGEQRAQIDGVGIAWRGTAMSRGTYTGHPGNVSGRVIAHQTSSSSASLALTISSTCPVYLLVVLSSSPSARRTSSSPTSPSLASRSSASLA